MTTRRTSGRAVTKKHPNELTREEGWELLDRAARRYLQMSAAEFIAKWDVGELRDRDHSDLLAVYTLLPFVR